MTLQMFGPKTCPTRGPERPFRCLDKLVNYIFAASHAIDQAGNMNEDDQTREMNDEDQATDMLDDDQTRGMEETEMDISENEIEEQR